MMDRTDRWFRQLMRLISRRTWLYTEMVTANAILHGDRDRLLAYDAAEHPVALQLGGDEPDKLAQAARIGAELGYDEINLNVGCPSDRVQRGSFGACLMLRPERVAECVSAMQAVVDVPVTVKHRIGVDDHDAYEDMLRFVDVVSAAGCRVFSVHARKAWLSGLSPKQNREVPPLRYGEVHRLKAERPDLVIEINGGIRSLAAVDEQLEHVNGVMIGRWAWDRPFEFSRIDRQFFGGDGVPSREEVVSRYTAFARRELESGGRPVLVLRPLLNLYAGEPGTRRWKQRVNAVCRDPRDVDEVLVRACTELETWRKDWRETA